MKTSLTRKVFCRRLLLFLCFMLLGSLIGLPNSVQASSAIVNPNQVYSYSIMQRDIEKLAAAYPELISYESLGQTKYGRELWAIKLGRGESTIFLNGSHHAREWMTTTLLMKMIDTYAAAYYNNAEISKNNIRDLLDKVTIWIVPMVNPDGVTLSQQGTAGLSSSLAKTLKQYNGNSTNFNRWKANMQGIDLNRQYPANWSNIKNSKGYPWYQNYKGKQPAQALEVQIMMNFTYKIDPELTIAYHSSGEILFWHYNTLSKNLARDKSIALDISKLTGYSLVQPEKNPSGGGYKDWFIQEFDRPGLTIEIGEYVGERSLALSTFKGIWAENVGVPLYSAQKSYALWLEKQKVQYLQQTMSLLGDTKLYSKINASSGVSDLEPQEVEITAQKGDWYQVNTHQGTGWIHPSPGMLINIENINATVNLQEDTLTYKYPDSFSPKVSIASPQTVQVTGKWDKWLLASFENGNWWIDGRKLELQEPMEEAAPEATK
ncbi:g-D-glutamyl-meso-diaminopimelate peptidase [Fontibacillus panacisegetis]|uniref:G-D-glutamyl-meso-diaminopimelate peptidase n=1 Tax=Fontibacillus panacisegetis TaxID=670482 RepID=A0A1G7NLH5_9BACL|nr:g-D-glutamyl-meso-diaminopimelate peptidase [Fontibacillus panacisegetis]